MFNFSWGELVVVTGLGFAFLGRHDLPKAAHMLGTQLGRVVGLLQGARARADRYAAQSELRQLQNELRAGLRELDAVKSELAVTMSPVGMMGRTLGPMTPNAYTRGLPTDASVSLMTASNFPAPPVSSSSSFMSDRLHTTSHMSTTASSITTDSGNTTIPSLSSTASSVYSSTAAVAEQEWAKQGIAFTSAAERGTHVTSGDAPTGSQVLSRLLRESLIFDQYDRAVAEQNALLQSKVQHIQDTVAAQRQPPPVTLSSKPLSTTSDADTISTKKEVDTTLGTNDNKMT